MISISPQGRAWAPQPIDVSIARINGPIPSNLRPYATVCHRKERETSRGGIMIADPSPSSMLQRGSLLRQVEHNKSCCSVSLLVLCKLAIFHCGKNKDFCWHIHVFQLSLDRSTTLGSMVAQHFCVTFRRVGGYSSAVLLILMMYRQRLPQNMASLRSCHGMQVS